MPKILLIGYSTETTFGYTITQFRKAGASFDVIDLALFKSADQLVIARTAHGLALTLDDKNFAVQEYKSLYHRARFVALGSPGRDQLLRKFLDLLYAEMEGSEALIVNRLSAGASNHNKFLHLEHLREAGFQVPDQIIVGSQLLACSVIPSDGSWINKSCSAMKTEVVAVDAVLASQFFLLPASPSLFQKKISGRDVRVHVVGREIFAVQIGFQGVDYRFPGNHDKPEYKNIEIPVSIRLSCFTYCTSHRLPFAGFDFKLCHNTGAWYVLEANPMPGYDMYDRRLGGAISSSLLSLLTAGFSPATKEVEVSSSPFVAKSRRHIINPLTSSSRN